MQRLDLRALAAVVRREHQVACRGSAFWGVTVVGSLIALWRASPRGTTAALAAYQTWQLVVVGLGAIAVMLAGAAASRDRRHATLELVLAKPGGSSSALVAARFAGIWLSLLTMVAIVLAGASVGQVALARTPWAPAAYGSALLLSVVPIGLAAAFGFVLATLLTTPLAAGVAAIYWVVIPLARSYMPTVLDLTLSQHWPLAATLGAALVTLTAALYARSIRGEQRGRTRMGWASAVLLAAAAGVALGIISRGDDGLVKRHPLLSAMAGQTAAMDRRAPGFWLPDASGRLVGLDDLSGRIVLLAFWGPAAPDSARVLEELGKVARAHAPEEVACVAICVDRDAAAMGPFAREVGRDVAMVRDRGWHYGDGQDWSDSPLAVSYGITEVPTVLVLDRERTLSTQWQGTNAMARLESSIPQLLAGQ